MGSFEVNVEQKTVAAEAVADLLEPPSKRLDEQKPVDLSQASPEVRQFLQRQIINYLQDRSFESPAQAELNSKVLKELKTEAEKGVFASASQRAYREFVGTYINGSFRQELLKTILHAKDLGLDLAAGAPFERQREQGRLLSAHELAAKLSKEQLNFNYRFDQNKLPDLKQTQAYIDSRVWKEKQDLVNFSSSLKGLLTGINRKIDESQGRYPQGWKYKEGENKLDWANRVIPLIELRDKLGDRIEFWHLHNKSSKGPDFPDGVEIKVDSKGKLESITVPMPESPNLTEPKAKALIEYYQSWLAQPFQDLSKTAEVFSMTAANPYDGILQGYTPIAPIDGKPVRGVFSPDNRFLYMAPQEMKDSELKPGESFKPINLIYHDTQVSRDPDGNVRITLSKQPLYLGSMLGRNWMAGNVGEPKITVIDGIKPETPLPVGLDQRDYRAAGSLKDWVEWRKTLDTFFESSAIACDLSLFAIGGLGLFAFKSGKLALTAAMAEAGTNIAARKAGLEYADHILKLSVGALGAVDNVNTRTDGILKHALEAKHVYIMFDVSRGLLNSVKGLSPASAAFHRGIQERLSQSLSLNYSQKAAHAGMRFSEPLVVAGSIADISHQIDLLNNPEQVFDANTARAALNQGRQARIENASKAKAESGKQSDEAARQQTLAKISELEKIAFAGSSKSKESAQISEIMSNLKGIISGEIEGAKKESLIQEWSKHFAFGYGNESGRSRIEQVNNGPLSKEQEDALFDKRKRGLLPSDLKRIAEISMPDPDSALNKARAIALFFAARDKSGKLPDLISKFKIDLPAYLLSESRLEAGQEHRFVKIQGEQQIEVSVSSKRITGQLELLFERSKTAKQTIILGELLHFAGIYTASQYAQSLLGIIQDRASGKAEKLAALADAGGYRLADLYPQMLLSEEKSYDKSAGYLPLSTGSSAAEIEQALMKIIESESDSELRAMAAAVLYAGRASLLNPQRIELIRESEKLLSEKAKDAAVIQLLEKALSEDLSLSPSIRSLQAVSFILSSRLFNEQTYSKIAEALLANISPNHAFESTLAVSLLSKEVFEKFNPESANLLCEKMLRLAGTLPSDQQDDELKSLAVARLSEIYSQMPPESKQSFQSTLKQILNDHNAYSRFNKIRTEAISAVKDLNLAKSFQAELKSLASRSLYPEIRQKAFEVLLSGSAPETVSLDESLLKRQAASEPDPALSAQLNNKLSLEKLVKSSQKEIDKIWSDYISSIDGPISEAPFYEILRNFKWQDQNRFLAQEVFLLDYHSFKEEAKAQALNSWWFADRFFGDPDRQEKDAVDSILSKRELHWQRLLELASGKDRDKALKARYMLYQAASSNGVPFTRVDKQGEINTGRQSIKFDSPRSVWEKKALDALLETLKPGTPHRDYSLHLLRMALSESNPWPSPAARRQLFESWQEQLKNKTISQKEYYLVLAANLRAEQHRLKRDYEFESKLQEQLAAYPELLAWAQKLSRDPVFWINHRN